MNFKLACEHLEIEIENNTNNINQELIKTQYHKLALKYHPDKNKNADTDTTEIFRNINESYIYLSGEIKSGNLNDDEFNCDDNCNNNNTSYFNILNVFLNSLLKEKYTDIISSIIKNIVIGCNQITLKMFDDIDKENVMIIYSFLFKYKNILYIDDVILTQIYEIIIKKYKDMQIYVLNPSINDLFNSNVYKLQINNVTYYVPLWHNELYFENKSQIESDDDVNIDIDIDNCDNNNNNNNNDIVVKCIPELPSHVNIDEHNNILVTLHVSLSISILSEKTIQFSLGEKVIHIPIEDLKFKKIQTIVLKKQGILKISENIYNINMNEKSDIIVKIIFIE